MTNMSDNADLLADDSTTQNTVNDPLAELVGEGKKFKDAAALAKAKLEADAFIEQLKRENAEMRAAGKKDEGESLIASKVDELLKKLDSAPPSADGNQPDKLTRAEVEKLVRDGLKQGAAESARASNRVAVSAEVIKALGGDKVKATEHIDAKAAELGLSKEAVREMAETNPRVFKQLFLPQTRSNTGTTSFDGRRTDVIDQADTRGKSYWDGKRKELGARFWEPAIQQQRFADIKRLGDKFNSL